MDSNTAKKIKSKNTQIELKLGKAMWAEGLRYRKQCKDVFGKPDFCFKGKKIAIFCDSEFWHGKNFIDGEKFKTNVDFWENKIQRNIERDKVVNKTLIEQGWSVLRFWSKEINKDINKCIDEVKKTYEEKI